MFALPGVGIGIIVLIVVLVLATVIGTWMSRYRKVGPNEVLIVSGRSRKVGNEVRGFRVVRNGGTFVMPVLEMASTMSLRTISSEVSTRNAISKEGVPVSVAGTALFKVSSTDEGIANAAERYLGNENAIKKDVNDVLDGHLRGVVGQLTPEEIYRDRQAFQEQIAKQAQADLIQLGITLDTLTLKDIDDEQGYLKALGERRIAEVKRDARIGTAEAEREAIIKEAAARQASEEQRAQAETEIAGAYKNRDVEKARYDTEVLREQARRDQATAEEEAIAQQKVETARTNLAKATAARREEELVAEVIKPSEAQREADVIRAEGESAALERRAAAQRKEREEYAAAEAFKIEQEGTAKADATRAQLQAEADGEKAKLLAEAEGLEKKAEALAKFNDASIRIELSKAAIEIMPRMVAAASDPISNIKDFKVVDFGGNGNGNGNGHHGGALNSLLSFSPAAIAKASETLKQTTGLDLTQFIGLIRTGDTPTSPTLLTDSGEEPDGEVTES